MPGIDDAIVQVFGSIAVDILECPDAAKMLELAQRYDAVKAKIIDEQGGTFTPEQRAQLVAKIERDVSKPVQELVEANLSVFESVVTP